MVKIAWVAVKEGLSGGKGRPPPTSVTRTLGLDLCLHTQIQTRNLILTPYGSTVVTTMIVANKVVHMTRLSVSNSDSNGQHTIDLRSCTTQQLYPINVRTIYCCKWGACHVGLTYKC